MFKLKIDETNEYDVSFKHSIEGKVTICEIKWNDRVIAKGVALCSIVDQFNRNIGRKVALKHALDNMGYDKEFRKMIWEKYFQVRNGKKE